MSANFMILSILMRSRVQKAEFERAKILVLGCLLVLGYYLERV